MTLYSLLSHQLIICGQLWHLNEKKIHKKKKKKRKNHHIVYILPRALVFGSGARLLGFKSWPSYIFSQSVCFLIRTMRTVRQ